MNSQHSPRRRPHDTAPRLRLIVVACLIATPLLACPGGPGERLEANGCEVYFKEPVPPRTARQVLEFIVSQDMCDGTRKTMQLTTSDGPAWQLRMVWKPEFLEDQDKLLVMKVFGAQLAARVLDGEPLALELTDDKLQTLKTVETPRWGRLIQRDSCELYAAADISDEQALAALDALEEVGCKAHVITFRIARSGAGIELYVVVRADALADPATLMGWRTTAGRVAHEAFEGAPSVVHLTDEWMQTQQTGGGLHFGEATRRPGCEVFRGKDVSAEAADDALSVLDLLGHCTPDMTKSYSMSRRDGGWHFAAVRAASLDDTALAANRSLFVLLATMLRGALDGAPTTYSLCDGVFEQCTPFAAPADHGKLFHQEGCFVLYPRGDSAAEASLNALVGVLARENLCKSKQVLSLSREAGVATVRLMVAVPEAVETKAYETEANKLVRALREEVFGGAPTALLATDAGFKELRRFVP